MNALSSTLKRRYLVMVTVGLHVGNMFANREASPIEATETVHVMSLGIRITRPGFDPPDVGAVLSLRSISRYPDIFVFIVLRNKHKTVKRKIQITNRHTYRKTHYRQTL